MSDEPRTVHRRPLHGRSVSTVQPVYQGGPAWTPNWIDHRSSRANVHRRIDRGDIPPTCAACGCETDISPAPHSPRCSR